MYVLNGDMKTVIRNAARCLGLVYTCMLLFSGSCNWRIYTGSNSTGSICCCTTNCATDPQKVEPMEFDRNSVENMTKILNHVQGANKCPWIFGSRDAKIPHRQSFSITSPGHATAKVPCINQQWYEPVCSRTELHTRPSTPPHHRLTWPDPINATWPLTRHPLQCRAGWRVP